MIWFRTLRVGVSARNSVVKLSHSAMFLVNPAARRDVVLKRSLFHFGLLPSAEERLLVDT